MLLSGDPCCGGAERDVCDVSGMGGDDAVRRARCAYFGVSVYALVVCRRWWRRERKLDLEKQLKGRVCQDQGSELVQGNYDII